MKFQFIHSYLEKQAKVSPNAIVVIDEKLKLTYKELNEKSNIFANYLKSLEVSPEKAVGILLEPSIYLAISIFAVLKAGGVYVPISPEYPYNRVDYILNDSNTKILLTNDRFKDEFKFKSKTTICPDSFDFDDLKYDKNDLSSNLDENKVAYILYTSGSTGNPKGVVLEHRQVLAYLDGWYLKDLQKKSKVLLPLTSSMCFAAAVTQFFTPFLHGNTLNILQKDIIKQPELLLKWYEENPNFGLYCVPTLWEQIITYAENQKKKGKICNYPKGIYLSGEAVPEKLASRTFEIFPKIRMWNLYGPTEATANVSYSEIKKDDKITIGKPITNCKIYILDKNLNKVKEGDVGELYATGPNIARCYLNRAELTSKTFIKNPFDDNLHKRLYKSGDLAKINKNGDLEFCGRADHQVKIRGIRIELGEIESVLNNHENIRKSVVMVVGDENNDENNLEAKKLVAYILFHKNLKSSINDLRNYLSCFLPSFMIPSLFIPISYFHLLANGKIDRSKLPIPSKARPALDNEFLLPTTDTEKILIGFFKEILNFDDLGVGDSFFDLGGNSLQITSLQSKILDHFNIKVSYKDIFSYETVNKLAQIVDETIDKEKVDNYAIKHLYRKEDFFLSFNQKNLWFLNKFNKNLTAYNISFTIDLKGDLDVQILKASINKIIERYEALRTTFTEEGDNLLQKINDPFKIELSYLDLSNLDHPSKTKSLIDILFKPSKLSFDLENGPLISFDLVKLSDTQHILVVIVHHIIFDEISINIFAKELKTIYNSYKHNLDIDLPLNKNQLIDYCLWEKEFIEEKNNYKKLSSFWKQELQDANMLLEMPLDHKRPIRETFNGNTIFKNITSDLAEKLVKFNKNNKTTAFISLFAVFNLLVYKYTKQEDILIGCPVSTRVHLQMEKIIGFFVNTIVLRTKLNDGISFSDLLSHVKIKFLESYESRLFPFEKLIEELKPKRSLSHNPIFQVMFEYHDQEPDQELVGSTVNGLTFKVNDISSKASKFDLTFGVKNYKSNIKIWINYNTDLFISDTIKRLLDQFVLLLEKVLENPYEKISHYSLLSQSDYKKIIFDFNNTEKNRKDLCIHELFEVQAEMTPNAFALHETIKDHNLTYKMLNKRANYLAKLLVEKGAKPNTPIGVFMENSIDMITSLFAILKAGACYLPLDPNFPAERISYMIKDSQVKLILTQNSIQSKIFDNSCELISVENILNEIKFDEVYVENLLVQTDPSNFAYLMYTSGSTGKPKGVCVPHRGVSNFIFWLKDRFYLSQNDNVLSSTTINFDISVLEIFWPLITGASVVLGKTDINKNPEILAETINKFKITNIQFVPTALKVFADSGYLQNCNGLKRIFSGGEALSVKLQKQVLKAFDGKLHNLYGPTEASVYMCHYDCNQSTKNSKIKKKQKDSVCIGRPIYNSKVYILDNNFNPVPVAMKGELYIGGNILADGYLNKEELTNEKFIKNPFAPQEKIYKTGDWAIFNDNGTIEFLGRIDHQVKVRGYRIELGEIEHQLSNYPEIDDSLVIVSEDKSDVLKIIAYYICKNKNINIDELRAFLKSKLPDYMIPSLFIPIEKIPVLPNGKVNYKALPHSSEAETNNYNADKNFTTKIEKVIAEIWTSVLGVQNIKPNDNFFDIGGHSLLIIKIRDQIRKKIKAHISIIDMFQYPSIESIAKHIQNNNEFYEKHKEIGKRMLKQKQAWIAKKKNQLKKLKK